MIKKSRGQRRHPLCTRGSRGISKQTKTWTHIGHNPTVPDTVRFERVLSSSNLSTVYAVHQKKLLDAVFLNTLILRFAREDPGADVVSAAIQPYALVSKSILAISR